MTEPQSANRDQNKPISKAENRQVRGLALMHQAVFEKTISDVEELRARHAAWLESLPTEPTEAIKAARIYTAADDDGYPEGFLEAQMLSPALEALIKLGHLGEAAGDQDAAIYIAERITDNLKDVARQLDLANAILASPSQREIHKRFAAEPAEAANA